MVTALEEPPLRSADDHCPFEVGDLVAWVNLSPTVWNPSWRMTVTAVRVLTHRRFRLTLEPVPPCPAPRLTSEWTDVPGRSRYPMAPRLVRVR